MSHHGFSVIEVLVALAIMVILLLSTFEFLALITKKRLFLVLKANTSLTRIQLMTRLQDVNSWKKTVADTTNLNMDCLRKATPCTGGGNFKLSEANGSTVYDGTLANSGYTADGALCSTFSSAPGNDQCPLHLDLQWMPICKTLPCSPRQIKVTGDFQFNPESQDKKNPWKIDNYHIDATMEVPSGPSVVVVGAISNSGYHNCAVVNGGAQCWGWNKFGELGNGTVVDSPIPVQVQGLTSGVTAITAATYHSCAIANGGAQCWGMNGASGFLGNGSSIDSQIPVQVQGLTSGVSAISASSRHTCAVVNGAAYCWGYNGGLAAAWMGFPAYGDNLFLVKQFPVLVQGLTSGVTAIASSNWHTCAVVNGSAQCWGDNSAGELGNNTNVSSLNPVLVQGLSSGVTDIAVSDFISCAIQNGAAFCWGFNMTGGLGDGTVVNSSVPVPVVGLNSGVTAITAGCAIVGGAAKCWGQNPSGQLGNNLTANSPVPVQVQGLTSGVSSITPGGCAVMNARAQCWGPNNIGQLGNNSAATMSLIPGPVLGL